MSYYQILGVTKHATLAEIKRSYKELANAILFSLIYDAKNETLHQKAEILNEAYEVLSYYFTRYLYDLGIEKKAIIVKEFKKGIIQYRKKINIDLQKKESYLFDEWLIKFNCSYDRIKNNFICEKKLTIKKAL